MIYIIDILSNLIGCFFALLIYNTVDRRMNKEKNKTYSTSVRRTVLSGKFSDPLKEYDRIKDEKTNLYKTYVPKKVNRIGDDTDEI